MVGSGFGLLFEGLIRIQFFFLEGRIHVKSSRIRNPGLYYVVRVEGLSVRHLKVNLLLCATNNIIQKHVNTEWVRSKRICFSRTKLIKNALPQNQSECLHLLYYVYCMYEYTYLYIFLIWEVNLAFQLVTGNRAFVSKNHFNPPSICP